MSTEETLHRAQATAPDDPAVRPADLHLDRKTGLRIRWGDGREDNFPLDYLRRNCPCATCRTEREKPAATARPGGLSLNILPRGIERAVEVVDAGLVGQYALTIRWGDGHATGIYDFRYLRAIAPPPGKVS